MTFWILAALLTLAAVGFALAPFLRRAGDDRRAAGRGQHGRDSAGDNGGVGLVSRPATAIDRPAMLRGLYRQRVAELQEESAAGILEESSRAEVEQELGQGLLDEFGGTDTASASVEVAERHLVAAEMEPPSSTTDTDAPRGYPPHKSSSRDSPRSQREIGAKRAAATIGNGNANADSDVSMSSSRWGRVWLLAVVGIPLLALVLYLRVGEPDADMLRGAVVVLELDPVRDRLQLDRWRVRLAERLRRVPDDAQTQYLLGRVYLKDGEYERAAELFASAHTIVGDDPSIDLVWLQALFLADAGRLDEPGKRIGERILARDPNEPMVLEMMAINAYRSGEYRDSVHLFSRALGNAVEPRQRTALELFLGQARSMLGDLAPSIDVELTILQAPPASATLFVIARPVGGGMPFAVVRRAAAPLPDRVRLDDAVSMNPALPLSAANEIEVVVRISLTGAAVSHPGDWEWRSEPLLVADAGTLALVAELGPPEPAD